jgi:Transglycosylase SLT domain
MYKTVELALRASATSLANRDNLAAPGNLAVNLFAVRLPATTGIIPSIATWLNKAPFMNSTTVQIPSFVSLTLADLERIRTPDATQPATVPAIAVAAASIHVARSPGARLIDKPSVARFKLPNLSTVARASHWGRLGQFVFSAALVAAVCAVALPNRLENQSAPLASESSDHALGSTAVRAYLHYSARDNGSEAIGAPNSERRNLARFLADRYRIQTEQSDEYVRLAFEAGREINLDPWLILAIMSIESSLNPRAVSPVGARGLMQVHTRVHADKFKPHGGVHAAFEPDANIRVGAGILRDYIDRHGGVAAALKAYVGAALLPDDGGYAAKVLYERDRLGAVAFGLTFNETPPVSILKKPNETSNQLNAKSTEKLDAAISESVSSRIDPQTETQTETQPEPHAELVTREHYRETSGL